MSVYAVLQMARTLVLALAIATACGAPRPQGRGDGVTPGLGPENTVPFDDSPMERCSGWTG